MDMNDISDEVVGTMTTKEGNGSDITHGVFQSDVDDVDDVVAIQEPKWFSEPPNKMEAVSQPMANHTH